MKNNENKYLIGEFADLVGVDADTIRFYEKQGILKSKRNRSNNYRYYTDTDCRALLACRSLRALGFSIRQIQEQKCDPSRTEYCQFLEKKERELLEEERRLRNTREQLAFYRQAANLLQNHPGDVWFTYEQKTYCFFRQTEEALLRPSVKAAEQLSLLMKRMPLTFQAGIHPLHLFWPPEQTKCPQELSGSHYEYECGLMIEQHMLEDDGLISADSADRIFSWSACCQMILSGKYHSNEMEVAMLRPMVERISSQGYAACGDAIGRLLPTNPRDDHWYILYSIPIVKRAISF